MISFLLEEKEEPRILGLAMVPGKHIVSIKIDIEWWCVVNKNLWIWICILIQENMSFTCKIQTVVHKQAPLSITWTSNILGDIVTHKMSLKSVHWTVLSLIFRKDCYCEGFQHLISKFNSLKWSKILVNALATLLISNFTEWQLVMI